MGNISDLQRILYLFDWYPQWDCCSIMSETGFDVKLLMQICNQLEDEGIIAVEEDQHLIKSNTIHSHWIRL